MTSIVRLTVCLCLPHLPAIVRRHDPSILIIQMYTISLSLDFPLISYFQATRPLKINFDCRSLWCFVKKLEIPRKYLESES